MAKVIKYGPTGETVIVLGIANRGQYKPGDPGRGMRLYRVEFVGTTNPSMKYGQASASELYVTEDGKRRAFREQSTHVERDW